MTHDTKDVTHDTDQFKTHAKNSKQYTYLIIVTIKKEKKNHKQFK